MDEDPTGCSKFVVVDTNVFVAAGFHPRSRSAEIFHLVRARKLHLIWSDRIRDEVNHTVGRIRMLPHDLLDGLFREENRRDEPGDLAEYAYVEDPADRVFAALAASAGAILITTDHHLLQWRERIPAPVVRPGEFMDGRP